MPSLHIKVVTLTHHYLEFRASALDIRTLAFGTSEEQELVVESIHSRQEVPQGEKRHDRNAVDYPRHVVYHGQEHREDPFLGGVEPGLVLPRPLRLRERQPLQGSQPDTPPPVLAV